MSQNKTYLCVLFAQGTPLEEMQRTLTSAGFQIFSNHEAGFHIMTISVPTDQPEEVEREKMKILALPNVQRIEYIEIPEGRRRPGMGAENPATFNKRIS